MEPDDLARAYTDRSSKTDEIEDAIAETYEHPSHQADALFFSIIDDYHPEDRSFWIKQAIMYADKAIDRATSQQKLEQILEQADRYWNLGALLGTVATQLGRIASYPNHTLGKTIEFDRDPADEVDRMILLMLRSTAYGAYIATATDFFTGRDAGNEVESRNIQPTLAMAENFIAKHSQKEPTKIRGLEVQ